MAASPYSIDPTAYLDDLLSQASPDLMRQMLQDFINQILSTQAYQVCGADYATTSESRSNTHNGYRHRDLDTRVGTIDVAVPKLRTGSFFPDWLLERRTRAERALTTVIATCYLKGVSTRRMNDLVASWGSTISRSPRYPRSPKTSTAWSRIFAPNRWTPAPISMFPVTH